MGLLKVDRDGKGFRFASVNDRVIESNEKTNISDSDFYGVDIFDYAINILKMSSDAATALKNHYIEVYNTQLSKSFETEVGFPNENQVTTETTLHPIKEGNEVTYILYVTRNITERKIQEQEVNELNKRLLNQSIKEQKLKIESIIQGQEAERSRISKELHDSVNQVLGVIKRKAENALQYQKEARCSIEDTEHILKLVQYSIDEVRRISCDLMPTVLYDFGLVPALKLMLKDFDDPRIKLEAFTETIDNYISRDNKVHLYRIYQESLNNAIKHSKAKEIVVKLTTDKDNIYGSIADDGIGVSVNGESAKGQGMFNIEQRVLVMAGQLQIEGSNGTNISFKIPLNNNE